MGQTQSQLIQEPFWGGWWRRRRARRRRRRARRRRRLPRHNVRIGNWTNYVKQMQATRLKNPLLWFLIGRSGGGRHDPARGCSKRFNATYRCGYGPTKSVNISAEAWGKYARFDCQREHANCLRYRLILRDNGNIELLDSNSRKIWESNTYKVGLKQEKYMAKNSKYGRNYIKAGEYLEENEFIGSPSGNCYLLMTRNGLDLCYENYDCKINNDSIGYGKSNNAYTLYKTSVLNKDNIKKTGYVSYGGKLIENKDNNEEGFKTIVEGFTDDYHKIDNWNTSDYNLNLSDHNNLTGIQCANRCYNLDDCGGFFFSEPKNCQLKKNDIQNNNMRVEAPNGALYIKKKTGIGEVTQTTGNDWDKWIKDDETNIKKLNELQLITSDEKNTLLNSNNEMLKKNNEFKKLIDGLSKDYSTISLKTKEDIKKFIQNLDRLYNYASETEKIESKMNNLDGMKTDSELQLIKNNKEYLIWTIATIFVVIVGIKIIKKN